MKKSLFRTTAIAAALAACQAPAFAVDTGIDWLKISGFGTIAATRSSIDKSNSAYFNPNLTSIGGAKDSWNGGTDSRLGLQVVGQINSALSATVQVLSRKDEDGSYRPKAEWANLKYQFTPDVAVRVGRVGLPAFLISDYLSVGYSQPWIRPPVEAYIYMPMTHVDGADAIFRFQSGDTTFTVQPAVGKSEYRGIQANRAGGVEVQISGIRAINVSAEHGPWTARYGKVRATTDVPGTVNKGINDDFNNLGVIYDKDAWLVQGEYIWRTTNSIPVVGNLNMKMGYLTTGYRFGKVMPHLTFSRYIDDSTLGQKTTQNSTSVGVRWDFAKNLALKAQYDRIDRPSNRARFGYSGLFNIANNPDPFRLDNKSVNVVTVGLDFVF